MQGKKEFTPKLFHSINLQTLVTENNFYRRLDKILDLHWLYKSTAKYYGTEEQESIDFVVFFKIYLVGYLNGIHSDRKLIEYCKDNLSSYRCETSFPLKSKLFKKRIDNF